MKKRFLSYGDTFILLFGEILVSLLVIGGYLLVDLILGTDYFSYRVITGVILGSAVIVLNYFFLRLFLNRAVNGFMNKRGKGELDEEAAAKFAAENMAPIKNTITISLIVRTLSMLAALVVAFILDWFAPIATVVPIVAFRPILTISSLVRNKRGGGMPLGIGADFRDISEDGGEGAEDNQASLEAGESTEQKEDKDLWT